MPAKRFWHSDCNFAQNVLPGLGVIHSSEAWLCCVVAGINVVSFATAAADKLHLWHIYVKQTDGTYTVKCERDPACFVVISY